MRSFRTVQSRLFATVSFITALLLVACDGDKSRVSGSGQALVVGRVRSEDGSELKQVRVQAGDKAVRTKADGSFEISVKAGSAQRVAVDSEDFAGGEVVLKLDKDSTASVELSVLPVKTFKVKDAEQGGRLEDPDGFALDLPTKSLRFANGSSVKGEAEARYVTVREAKNMRVPPELRGVTKGGRETPLASKGLVEVRFYKDGQRVELDGEAEIEVPLPEGSSAKDGDRIPLYHYEEETGQFKEEREAVVEDGKWKAKVDKFSWWAAAEPVETSCIHFTLRTPEDEAAHGVVITARGVDDLWSASARTSADGEVCVPALAGSAVQLNASFYQDGAVSDFSARTQASEGAASCGGDDCQELGDQILGGEEEMDAGGDAGADAGADAGFDAGSEGGDFQRVMMTAAVSQPGTPLTFAFLARGGERLAYSITSRANQVADIRVLGPDGQVVSATGMSVLSNASTFRDTFVLPAIPGTYTLEVVPRSAGTGSFDVDLFSVPQDISMPIVVDGAASALAIPAIGQNAFLTWTAQAGERFAYTVDSTADGVTDLEVLGPGDTRVTGTGFSVLANSSQFSDLFILPAVAGEYRIALDPRAQSTGNFSVRLFRVPADLTVSGAIDAQTPGSLALNAVAQNGEYRFMANGGERLAYTVTSTADSVTDITLVNTTGQPLNPGGITVLANTSTFQDLFTLPTVPGSYALRVNPRQQGTGTITLRLFSVPADVAVDAAIGTSGMVTIPSIGQQGLYRFSANRGARLSYTVSSTASSVVDLSLIDPAGELVSGVGMSTVLAQSSTYRDLFTLPDRSDADTGPYALRIDPRAQGTGSVTIRIYSVPAPTDVPLTLGQPSSFTVGVPGQVARFTLSLTAGQTFSYVVSRTGTSTADVQLLDPSQANITPSGRGFLNAASLTVPSVTVPTTGIYTIQIDPRSEAIDSYQVTPTSP